MVENFSNAPEPFDWSQVKPCAMPRKDPNDPLGPFDRQWLDQHVKPREQWGRYVRACRKFGGLTLNEAAHILGYKSSPSMIFYENGRSIINDQDVIDRFAAFCEKPNGKLNHYFKRDQFYHLRSLSAGALEPFNLEWLDKQDDDRQFGLYFKACREQAGLSMRKAACLLKFKSHVSIFEIEQGKRIPFTEEHTAAITAFCQNPEGRRNPYFRLFRFRDVLIKSRNAIQAKRYGLRGELGDNVHEREAPDKKPQAPTSMITAGTITRVRTNAIDLE